MSIRRLRAGLYRAARLLGDAQAVSRGPGAFVRRAERKAVGRLFGKAMRFLLPGKPRRGKGF